MAAKRQLTRDEYRKWLEYQAIRFMRQVDRKGVVIPLSIYNQRKARR